MFAHVESTVWKVSLSVASFCPISNTNNLNYTGENEGSISLSYDGESALFVLGKFLDRPVQLI